MMKKREVVRVIIGVWLVILFITLGGQEAKAATNKSGFKDAIEKGILAGKTQINVSAYGVTTSEVTDLFYDVYYANPYLFVAKWKTYSYFDNKVTKLNFEYKYTKTQISTYYSKFNAEVKNVLSGIRSSMTQAQKVLYVHDYFVSNYSYDYNSYLKACTSSKSVVPSEHFTAIGLMVNKTGVCQGYSLAFNYIMKKLGIYSEMVTSVKMDHAWNLVKVDGKYYHVDVSWDDPVYDTIGKVSHEYFMLSDAQIQARDHYSYKAKYKATSKKYDNYFWRTVNSAITYLNGGWYYVTSSGVINRYNFASNKSAVIYKITTDNKWYVMGSTRSYYKGNFSVLKVLNNKLYFNTKSKVYRLDVATKKATVVYKPNTKNGWVYGLGINGNYLTYQIKTKPSNTGGIYYCRNNSVTVIASQLFSVTVTQKKIANCKITISNKVYTGKAVVPTVIVKYGNTTLKKNVDYKLSYSNNKNLGTGKVTILGQGSYTGTVVKSFKIVLGKVSGVKTTSSSKSSVRIGWNKVVGAKFYEVYRYNTVTKKYVYVGKVNSNSCLNSKLKSNTKYTYVIRACAYVGKTKTSGAYSNAYKTYTK